MSIWAETPTPITPQGRTGDLAALREAVLLGQSIFRDRRVSIDEIVEEGSRAVWLGTWSATIGIEGLKLPVGARIEIRQAMLVEVHDGRIVRQRDLLAAPTAVD